MQRFEQIYAEHHEAVRAYVRRRAPEAVVDDVVSDTFLVCLRKIDRVPTEPLPWLYAVARKTLANERRKRMRVAHGHEVSAITPRFDRLCTRQCASWPLAQIAVGAAVLSACHDVLNATSESMRPCASAAYWSPGVLLSRREPPHGTAQLVEMLPPA